MECVSFGANQEAYVTLSNINTSSDEIDLLLKSQSNSVWNNGLIEVWYDPGLSIVQVVTYTSSQDWVQRGSDIPVSFTNGDRFGAQATSSGQVKVYKNSTLLATVDVTAWPYYASGGYIGLWTIEASGSLLDDSLALAGSARVGGGTIPQGRAPGWNLASLLDGVKALLRAPIEWVSQLFGGARQAALVPVKIHAEELQTETPPPVGQVWKNYILAGGQRVAVREYTSTNLTGTVYWLLGDHLGSTSVVTNAATSEVVSQIRYSAYGEERYTENTTPTNYRYTGQLSKISTVGLYQYGARWMDPTIAHFTQPDTMIPDLSDPLAWNRYSYANYNPIRYTDPTGHWVETALDIAFIGYDIYDISKNGLNWENGLSLTADVVGAILPVVTGGGLAVRAVMHADDVVDAVKLGDKAVDAVKAADKLDDAVDVIKAAGDICSFSSDTLITTSEGMEPISQIEEGDWVLAFDELSEDTGYFPVVARWEHKDLWTVELTIDGEVVETTPEHPFFVFEHGWVAAGDLWQGAQIIEADGELGIVEDAWIVYRPQSMYNLTVAEAHTYFVGNQQMLVHNACPIRKPTDSHHLIPNSAKDHDIIQYASSGGWEHNAPYNRMELPNSPQTAMNTGLPVHRGYNTPHRTYNSNMEKTLDRMWKASLQAGWTPTRAKQELFKLASRTRFNIWQSGKLIAK